MSTYKVIQDIEAEDKFLGPLTLKQFIYAAIAAVCTYLSFLLITKGAGIIALIFLPFILSAGFFAWPWSRDQPTEVWALAKIRFMLKPHRRIWNQSGVKELVTITAPKKIEKILSKNLSETEVRSRLEALANTIDSRGWAIKNVNVNLYSQTSYATVDDSDRLVSPSSLPQDVATIDVQPSDDILDERTNPTAQHFDQMIAASAQSQKQQIATQMRQAANNPSGSLNPPPDYWFMRGESTVPATVPSGYSTFQKSQVVTPGVHENIKKSAAPSASEQALLSKIHAEQNKPNPAYGRTHTIAPLSEQKAQKPSQPPSPPPIPAAPDPGILQLANNDDLNVATIARQADKANKKEPPKDEVVISLH